MLFPICQGQVMFRNGERMGTIKFNQFQGRRSHWSARSGSDPATGFDPLVDFDPASHATWSLTSSACWSRTSFPCRQVVFVPAAVLLSRSSSLTVEAALSLDPLQCGDYLQLCIKTRLDRHPRVIVAPPALSASLFLMPLFSLSLTQLRKITSRSDLQRRGIPGCLGGFFGLFFFGGGGGRAQSCCTLLYESLRLPQSWPSRTLVHVSLACPLLSHLAAVFFSTAAAHQQEAMV